MARINLLPWRAEERERKNRDFLTLLVLATLLAAATAFGAWYFFNMSLEDQRLANELIVAENAKLDDKLIEIKDLEIRREAIISRMKVIQDLQGRRPVPVHIWHDVAKAIPQATYLDIFERKGELLIFTGHADNPNVVSSLVRNLDASPWMQGAAVKKIEQNVSAYDSQTSLVPKTNTDGTQRSIYPEDSYVDFVVTTMIAAELTEETEDATSSDVALDTSSTSSGSETIDTMVDKAVDTVSIANESNATNQAALNDITNNDTAVTSQTEQTQSRLEQQTDGESVEQIETPNTDNQEAAGGTL